MKENVTLSEVEGFEHGSQFDSAHCDTLSMT